MLSVFIRFCHIEWQEGADSSLLPKDSIIYDVEHSEQIENA
jgi:hypothetical protein